MSTKQPIGATITWKWPVLLVFARLAFAVLAQALVAGLFAAQGHSTPWQAAAPWWPVYGSLIDVACLALIVWLVRREGLTLTQVVGFDRSRLGWDLLQACGVLLLFMPLAVGGVVFAGIAVYGGAGAPLPFGNLPLWAALYSVLIWPALWGFAEQTTYLGYALPRLEAVSGSTSIALALVVFGWAVQHIALPMGDPQWMLYRFLAFVPLGLILGLIFVRTRRLMPFIIAHGVADAVAAVTGVLLPGLS